LLEGCTIFNGYLLNARASSRRISPVPLVALILLAMPIGSYALADTNSIAHPASASSSSLPLIQFSIKPRLCVLNAGEEVCRDELEVKWLSEQTRSLCLYQSDKEEALRCWENETHGEYQFELAASASTDFQLREINTGTAVSDQRFQVVYNDKKYRRARRNPWSFF
jgi:hypothetical protein